MRPDLPERKTPKQVANCRGRRPTRASGALLHFDT
jgi:hypothetical protein